MKNTTCDTNYKFIKITPQLAAEWLKLNVINRRLKQTVIAQLVRDIISGNWQSGNPNPISFYEDGTLADGQHRLHAIVISNKAVYCRVVWNVPKQAGAYIDTNHSRNVADVINITLGDKQFTPKITSIIRIAFKGGKGFSSQDFIDLHRRYSDDIYYIMGLFSKTNAKLKYTPVIAAVLMAYLNGEKKQVIEDFCEVYRTGVTVNDRDITVTALRDFVLTTADKRGKQTNLEVILKAQQAIWNYANNRSVTRCLKCDEFKYPTIML